MSRSRRRAYILIIVLGFSAVATSLGLAFLSASGTVMPEAMNYAGSLRAGYIAGSGVALGMHYAMYPPTSVGYGQYWTGANNISVGAGNDYVNVTMARSDAWTPPQTDPNLYRVTATGVTYDADGTTVRAKKQITADIMAPLTGKWQVPYAFFSNGTVAVPAAVQLYGDMHTNGILSGLGWTQSKLTAYSGATWLGTGPPASITGFSGVRFLPYPSATTSYYSTYTIQGKTYTAYTGFSGNNMAASDAAALNALDMGANNPGRIIIAQSGTFTVKKGVQLTNCTLVVSGGDVQLDDDGSGTQLTSLPFFPALVVQGNISITHNAAAITINGAVICSGKIVDNARNSVHMDVTGTCIVGTGFSLTDLLGSGRYRFYYNQAKATFWDFQNVVAPQPATILNWQEN